MIDNSRSDVKTEALHGGDVYRNKVDIDYSVNLNPMEIPRAVKDACFEALSDIRHYPDPLNYDLRRAIACMDAADMDDIICGNGASELIMAAVHAVKPSKALITAPCYAGYRSALEAAGTEIKEHRLSEDDGFELTDAILEDLSGDVDMLFLGDPNNPSGRLTDAGLLERIKTACSQKGICLVIDECFLPLTLRGTEPPGKDDSAVHLRAFTKAFSIPGLRLGYAVCRDHRLLESIRRQLPEWNVSLTAQRAGAAAAAADAEGFLKSSVQLIEDERAFLVSELESLGIKTYPSDTNYLLLRSSSDLYDRLLEKGIMIRRCANFSGLDGSYFRIAVRSREDNRILIDTMKGMKIEDDRIYQAR